MAFSYEALRDPSRVPRMNIRGLHVCFLERCAIFYKVYELPTGSRLQILFRPCPSFLKSGDVLQEQGSKSFNVTAQWLRF